MRGLFTNQTLSLAAGQVLSGTAARAEVLRIKSGRVWITVEGTAHDYFLHAGDTFTAMPGRLTVVEADEDAGIESERRMPLPKLFAIVFARLLRGLLPAPQIVRQRDCDQVCCWGQ
jgi:hypothetical protein